MKKRSKSIYYVIVGLIALVFIARLFYKFRVSVSNDPVSAEEARTEYINLFKEKARSDLVTLEALNNKKRSQIARLRYMGKFDLIIYEISTRPGFRMDNIKIDWKGETGNDEVYYVLKSGYFDVKYMTSEQEPASEVFVSCAGSLNKSAYRDDRTLLYNLKYKSLSLRYSKEGQIDMYSGIEGAISYVPVSVAFIKHQQSLYFVLLAPGNPNEHLGDQLLFSLLK